MPGNAKGRQVDAEVSNIERRDFNYHPLQWTPEHVRRFWDFYAQNEATREIYFGRMFGDTLLRVCRKRMPLEEPVLDVACGPGHFLAHLLSRSVECIGIDTSPKSVQTVKERYGKEPMLRRAEVGEVDKLPLDDDSVRTAFLMEILEHLPPDAATRALLESHRVLMPGGHVVVTVPNEEDLRQRTVGCPNCGAMFHTTQHVQSYSPTSLSDLLRTNGFELVHVAPYNLGVLKLGIIRAKAREWIRRMLGRPATERPHLIGIARVSKR